MKIAVSTESTLDLTKDLIEKYDIKVIPYEIILGDKVYNDGEISSKEIFEFVDKNGVLPHTTALNEIDYKEYFESLKKDYDAVIHIALSGGITSSTDHAKRAGEQVDNVFVIDSRSLTTGIAMLAIYARELAEKGEKPQDIFNKVTERIPALQVSFVIERLDYLYKGGRCNSLQYFGANLLKLRPRVVLKDGKMKADKKYRGKMDVVVGKYCQDILEEFNTPDLDKVFITYTTASENMVNIAKEVCEKAGFKNIYVTRAGATVSSHCGANTFGIIYFNDGKKS